MAKMTLEDVQVTNQTVLMRCDFNIPLDGNLQITDDRRITASLPSIKKVISDGAALILCSHLGRPKGEIKPALSLKPVAVRLEELLGQRVIMASDCVGNEVQQQKKALKSGEILLLENLRFHQQEEKNDPGFAEDLADGCHIFVNDAFGTAHRAHASTEGVTHFIDTCVAGYLIEKELKYLGDAIDQPARPMTAILGGAKISGKIDVIRSLFKKVDHLLIGGGMVFTFLKAKGLEIGNSLLEEDRLEMAHSILSDAEERNISFLLPSDVVIADAFENDAQQKTVGVEEIPAEWMGLDIGPETIKRFSTTIRDSKTIIWNGPMGAFEMPAFSGGTRAIALALAEATRAGSISVVGGGDSAAAISKFNLEDQITHISTGGGASLEFLEGKELPGISALNDKKS
jgi:phosphoglycerate kinase